MTITFIKINKNCQGNNKGDAPYPLPKGRELRASPLGVGR